MTYPPPTLIKRRSRGAWVRYAVLLLTVAIVLGTCTATRFMSGGKNPAAADDTTSGRIEDASVIAPPEAPDGTAADMPAAAPAAAPEPQAEAVETQPVETQPVAPAPVARSAAGDARQANRWYYVAALGDGPGAIYSRTGGQWDYAFACVLPKRALEFVAVNTGNPRGFDQQSMTVGGRTQPMDATYARDGGGTISTTLPARHAFFDALTDGATVEVQLLANRRIVLPVGPDLVRLVRACRGR